MSFLGQVVVVLSMALVALCAGAIGYLAIALPLDVAALTSLFAFCVLVILHMTMIRARDKSDVARGLHDMGRALEVLTRDMAVIGNKMAALEHAGLLRAIQDVAAVRQGLQALEENMQDTFLMLEQHQLQIEALRIPEAPAAVVEEVAPAVRAVETAAQTRKGRLAALPEAEGIQLVSEALDAGRLELVMQPLVTLPQRKIRWYEVFSRLKTATDDVLLPDDFLDVIAKGRRCTQFDHLVLYRATQIVRRLQTRNKDIGLLVNLCPGTLQGGREFETLLEFLDANRALNSSLIFELPQAAYNRLSPLEFESMGALNKLGYKFAMDHVREIRFDLSALSDRSFRFVKVPADLLLGRTATAPSDIHPADLSDLMSRYGIELVAEKIETESTVIDVLDYDVRYGQGFLFAPPRPVKADLLNENDAAVTTSLTA